MPALPLLDSIVFSSFLPEVGQIYIRHAGNGDMEGHARELPIELRTILPQSLCSASGSRDDVLSSSSSIPGQFPLGAHHDLLACSDGVSHSTVILTRCAKQVVVHVAFLTILRELYLWFMPVTNMGYQQKGQ